MQGAITDLALSLPFEAVMVTKRTPQGDRKRMTMIRYEVFPVTLSSQQAILIQPPCPSIIPPWMIEHQPEIHPSGLVVEHLMTFFGSVFQPGKAIVH